MHLVLQRLVTLSKEGEWTSGMTGQGLEFVDYRGYIAGDDLRLLDWKAYVRLDQLIVRICQVEKAARILILIDSSRSMLYGVPTKWHFSLKAAAALSYISLFARDDLLIGTFDGSIRKRSRIFAGRHSIGPVLDYLGRLKPAGGTSSFSLLCEDLAYLCKESKPSLIIVLSDFLHSDLLPSVEVCHRFPELFFLQILASEEISPSLSHGSYQLVDSESGESLSLQWGNRAEDYSENLSHLLGQIDEACERNGIGHARCTTDLDFEDLILELLHSRDLIA